MTTLEKIEEIKNEIARTQKNKVGCCFFAFCFACLVGERLTELVVSVGFL